MYCRARENAQGLPFGCRASHHMADYLLEGIPGSLAPDPGRALKLYVEAELGYYEEIARGLTYYQGCLEKALAGQEKARAAVRQCDK